MRAMMRTRIGAIAGAAIAAMGSLATQAPAPLQPVTPIAVPKGAVVGGVCAFGPRAFVAMVGQRGGIELPVVVGAPADRGRVLAAGHEALLESGNGPQADNATRVAWQMRALTWLGSVRETADAAAAGTPDGRLVVIDGAGGLQTAARRLGWTTERVSGESLGALLTQPSDRATVLVSRPDIDERTRDAIRRAVRNGAGWVASGPGWGWQQLHPGQSLATEHGANRLLREFGVAIGDDTVRGPLVASTAETHALQAWRSLRSADGDGERHTESARRQAVAVVEHALGALPVTGEFADSSAFVGAVRAALDSTQHADRALTDRQPVTVAHPLRRLAIRVAQRRRRAAPGQQPAAPEAADFPGQPPADARPLQRTTDRVDLAVPGWHGFGIYARAGEPVTLSIPASSRARPAARRGLRVRVGCHQDRLWHKDRWQRAPEITVEVPLRNGRASLRTAYGGLLYLVVPRGRAGVLDVEIEGGYLAPRFVLGKTSRKEWLGVRDAPGPWAELESGRLTMTVPSSVIRTLEDPEPLLKFWNRVLESYAELGSRPLDSRPQRFVADRQISAGYMHSGYPIMTHLDAAPRMVDLKRLTTTGDWGLWHELGHNHQRPAWTFDGTVEVTCNLFSMFMVERFCGRAPEDQDQFTKQAAFMRRHWNAGAPFDVWKQRPFLALSMYVQVQREFGWEPFQRVFAEYERLPQRERPRTDADKRDQWLVRLSKTLGRNLGPFFERWGVPTSTSARRSIESLPVWLPAAMRPKR